MRKGKRGDFCRPVCPWEFCSGLGRARRWQPGPLQMTRGRKGSEEPARGEKGHATPPVAGDNQDREAASAARQIASVTGYARGSNEERG
jgi:hypothetical protein